MTERRQPKWQKARFLHCTGEPRVVGRTCWVQGVPEEVFTSNLHTRKDRFNRVQRSNLISPLNKRPLCLVVGCYELLPDFADDVPLVAYEDWLKGETVQ